MILIVIVLCFLFHSPPPLIPFRKRMCKEVCVCVCVAVNSLACYIRIVNDVTDSNTCLFSVSGFFLFFCFRIVCVRWCVCVCPYSHACYIWIVNDITDCNVCLFSVSGFYSISDSMCKKVCVCVAVNSCACYIRIVNDISDSKTFFSFFCFSFFFL